MSLKVLHISSNDSGGAGTAAYNTHRCLKDKGVNSSFLTLHKKTNNDDVIPYYKNKISSLLNRSSNKLREIIITSDRKFNFHGSWKDVVTDTSNLNLNLLNEPNVIILYSLSGFMDLEIIYELKKKYRAKIFWYLMDMGPMTGGCHFAWDCSGYLSDCSNCPAVRNSFNQIPKKKLIKNKEICSELDIEILTGGKWVTNQVKSSSIFCKNKIHEILLGVDESIFKPVDNMFINNFKKKHNIDKSLKIIAFGTSKLSETRKGLRYLIDSLNILFNKGYLDANEVVLLTAGKYDGSIKFDCDHIHLGYLVNDTDLASLYQVADVFISPSIEDSGPVMVNQAVMCGTPVISFDIGVAQDLIINNKTGYRAELGNYNDLARGINSILKLDKKKYNEMRNACREVGLKMTSFSSQATNLLRVFK